MSYWAWVALICDVCTRGLVLAAVYKILFLWRLPK